MLCCIIIYIVSLAITDLIVFQLLSELLIPRGEKERLVHFARVRPTSVHVLMYYLDICTW